MGSEKLSSNCYNIMYNYFNDIAVPSSEESSGRGASICEDGLEPSQISYMVAYLIGYGK